MENIDTLDMIDKRLQRIEKMLCVQKEVISLEELIAYTGYSEAHIYRLTSKNQIPHYKRANRLFFNRKEIDSWLMQNRVKTVREIESEASTYCVISK